MTFEKESFFASIQPKTAPVPLPGCDQLQLVQLSGADMQDYIDYKSAGNSNTAASAFMVVRSIRQGAERVFQDSEIHRFVALPNSVLNALLTEVNKLNGWDSESDEKN
jgi:hypothetical protein